MGSAASGASTDDQSGKENDLERQQIKKLRKDMIKEIKVEKKMIWKGNK